MPRIITQPSSYLVYLLTLGLFVSATARSSAKELSPALDLARTLNEAFVEVAESVSESVVVIEVADEADFTSARNGRRLLEILPEEFSDWYRERHERLDRQPNYSGRGSGIVIREDGYILTNSHVVEDVERIRVRFRSGLAYDATVQGVDTLSDVAVIKIDATGLTPARLADSAKVRVGEFAIAIGAPFDLDYSVTFGHVSAKGRTYVIPILGDGTASEKMDQNFIQTDASINPGNSGGPLVNIYGEVIGINTLIRGISTGIGFAIPINLAKLVADNLIEHGRYARAWLGIRIRSLQDDELIQRMVPEVKEGVMVFSINPDGPAASSDLSVGDIITHVDETPVSNALELRAAVRSKPLGSPLKVHVFRTGRQLTLEVRSGELAEETIPVALRNPDQNQETASALGVKVRQLDEETAAEQALTRNGGVIIEEVDPDSAAAKQGLQSGDIITEINHHPIHTPADFIAAAGNARQRVLLTLIRDGQSRFEILNGDRE